MGGVFIVREVDFPFLDDWVRGSGEVETFVEGGEGGCEGGLEGSVEREGTGCEEGGGEEGVEKLLVMCTSECCLVNRNQNH